MTPSFKCANLQRNMYLATVYISSSESIGFLPRATLASMDYGVFQLQLMILSHPTIAAIFLNDICPIGRLTIIIL